MQKQIADAKQKDKERRELETNWLADRVRSLEGELAGIAKALQTGKTDKGEALTAEQKKELEGTQEVKKTILDRTLDIQGLQTTYNLDAYANESWEKAKE